ncbi:MAG: substrate binding domain-containing protein [Pseudomonadota bacterium]
MDKLRALETFVTVVEQGSFASAADALSASRTATSKIVMDLEADLGTTLLTRTTRRLNLTDTGTAYYERAKRILDQVSEADHEAARETQNPRGRLAISAPTSFGLRHIAPNIKPFMDRYPDIRLDLSLDDRKVDLIAEGFDLTVRIGRLEDSTLIARKLGISRMLICAAPDLIETYGMPQTPADLRKMPCLGYPYWSGDSVWILEGPDGAIERLPLERTLWSNSGDALLAAAITGAGAVLKPDFIVGAALRKGTLVQMLPDWRGPDADINVLYPPTPYLPSRVRVFIDYLVECYANDPPWRCDGGHCSGPEA